jgi:D-aspartate ligase
LVSPLETAPNPSASQVRVRLKTPDADATPAERSTNMMMSDAHPRPAAGPPALLTLPSFNGTLAAVRALGRAGIPVTVADPGRFSMSAWSRYTSLRVQSPPVEEARRFIDWLLEFGRRSGRHVLLATNDDTAWLYSLYRAELAEHFSVAAPPIETVHAVLNKPTMYRQATDAGLDVPRTWYPDGADALDLCRREARFPVIVKPRTQVLFRTQIKGLYVEKPEDLEDAYLKFSHEAYDPLLLQFDPAANRPMVQEFHRESADGVYYISAYVHQRRLIGLRAARKLLQQPRRLGIGLCFEEAPVAPELVAGLERFVSRLDYSGVLQAEFIPVPGRTMLIDLNPRFYNPMAFEIARGVSLPLLAYYDALGDGARFDAVRDAAQTSTGRARVFIDVHSLRVMLAAQRLSGVLTREERQRWASWEQGHRDDSTHAVLDPADRLPSWLAGMQIASRFLRHPRAFIRGIMLNQG